MEVGLVGIGQLDAHELATVGGGDAVAHGDDHVLADAHALAGVADEECFDLGIHVGHLDGELPVDVGDHCRLLVADDAHGGPDGGLVVGRVDDATTDGELCMGGSGDEEEQPQEKKLLAHGRFDFICRSSFRRR